MFQEFITAYLSLLYECCDLAVTNMYPLVIMYLGCVNERKWTNESILSWEGMLKYYNTTIDTFAHMHRVELQGEQM